jgi:hypothetical protein
MNIKMILAILSLTFASAASASTYNFSAPRGTVNLGLPMIIRRVTSPRIDLTPSADPALVLALTLLPMGPTLPVIPVIPVMPGTPVIPRGPNMPFLPRRSIIPILFDSVAPALNVKLRSAPSKDSTPAQDIISSPEKLAEVFDGRKQPVEKSNESGPVRSGRHISLPENDLEKEIGAY